MDFGARKTLLLLLLLFSVVTIFTKLEVGLLPSYDDAYYAQKAREIVASGDLWNMTLAGKPRFDNPPGFMWLIAASYKVFGVSEFTSRLPSALGGVLGILGTFFLFELLFASTRIGFLAAVWLNATSVYLKYAKHSMMDTTVTASGVWCFYFFVRGMRGSPWWYVVAGAAGSYVFFAKSAFGVLPPMALFAYLIATRQWKPFKQPLFWLGCITLLLPYGIWCGIEYVQFGDDFIKRHFYNLIVHSSNTRGANDYWYDYVIVMLKYFPLGLPFMFMGIWQAIKARGREQQAAHWFGLAFFAVFFLMLSLQGTKKTWYFLPAFPACAGLAAVGLDRVLKKFSLEQLGRTFARLFVLVFLILLVTPVMLESNRAVEIKAIAPYVRAASKQGFKVVAYDVDYYGLNNALIFYSDVSAPSLTPEQFPEILLMEKVAVIFSPENWEKIGPQFPQLKIIRKTSKLILVSNAPLDQTEIF